VKKTLLSLQHSGRKIACFTLKRILKIHILW